MGGQVSAQAVRTGLERGHSRAGFEGPQSRRGAALCPTQRQETSSGDLSNHRSKVEQPQDMVTGNAMVVGLVVRFYRNGRGQSALREILGRVVQDVLEDKTLSVHIDPVHLYKSWINQSEAQTGQRR